jgi:hypothetical protein
MRQTSCRRGLQGFAFGLVLAMGGVAVAVEPDEGGELYLNSEFMIMSSFGTDLDALLIEIEDDTAPVETFDTFRQQIDSDVDFGWRGDLQWKEGPWGVGVSGFHYDNEGDEDASIDGSEVEGFITAGDSNESVSCSDDDEACVASADAEWETWMVDLYAIRELVSTPDVGLDLQVGMRIASFDWDANAFAAAFDPDDLGLQFATFVNSNSDLDDPLVGPFLSLLGTGRFGRFHLEGQLTQAVVFGDWDGVASYTEFNGGLLDDPNPVFTENLTSDRDLTIPITDVRIRVGYEVIDNLVLGVGGYATTWFNVPTPPWSEVDREDEETNVTLLGASFSLSYRFASGGLLPF